METKKCPFCAEDIKLEAIKCRYCGEFIEPKKETINTNVGVWKCQVCLEQVDTSADTCDNCGSALETQGDIVTEMEDSGFYGESEIFKSSGKGCVLWFGLLGAFLGLPLSYYFMPEIVRLKSGGISGYMQNFGEIINQSELVGNVVTSVIVFAMIGGIIGYVIDKNETKEKN